MRPLRFVPIQRLPSRSGWIERTVRSGISAPPWYEIVFPSFNRMSWSLVPIQSAPSASSAKAMATESLAPIVPAMAVNTPSR